MNFTFQIKRIFIFFCVFSFLFVPFHKNTNLLWIVLNFIFKKQSEFYEFRFDKLSIWNVLLFKYQFVFCLQKFYIFTLQLINNFRLIQISMHFHISKLFSSFILLHGKLCSCDVNDFIWGTQTILWRLLCMFSF